MSGWIRSLSVLGILAVVVLTVMLPLSQKTTLTDPAATLSRQQPFENVGLRDADVHRAVGLLQYVIGDYAEAVDASGQVLDGGEFSEQREILEDVEEILLTVTIPQTRDRNGMTWSKRILLRRLVGIQKSVQSHKPPVEVMRLCTELRKSLIDCFDLRCAPTQIPDLRVGRELYEQACAACHGLDGRSQTVVAQHMKPHPADFNHEDMEHSLTPYQVFNVMTFGVSDTAMPSFEALTPVERWNVSYYVLALRNGGLRERSAQSRLAPTLRMDPLDLSMISDEALLQRLAQRGVPATQRHRILAAIRCTALPN